MGLATINAIAQAIKHEEERHKKKKKELEQKLKKEKQGIRF